MTKFQIASRFIRNYLDTRSRMLPDILIIGAQKAGTSSLFEYLVQHPNIAGSFIKEVHFFTRRYWLGQRGYLAFFPKRTDSGLLNCEATPYYLFSSKTPERAATMVPKAKLIVLLREPVSRAYSHYKHNTRRGHETRSFEEAVASDLAMYRNCRSLERQPGESELAYRHHSYVRRGLYADQLERWLSFFPKENLFVGRAEDFFADPSAVTARVVRFLGLAEHPIATDQAHNQYAYKKRPANEFPELQEFFREPNQRLEKMTGISW